MEQQLTDRGISMDSLHIYTLKDVIDSTDHVEMIGGNILIEDRTTVQHNIAVSEIVSSFKNFISSNKGTCAVFSENVALYVNELCGDDKNFFLPDVMVVCRTDGIKDDGVHAAPKFVAEITSEATKKYDYIDKLEVYRKIGVDEYWVVDLQRNVVYTYLKDDEYIPQTFMHPKTMRVMSYNGLTIDMSQFIQ